MRTPNETLRSYAPCRGKRDSLRPCGGRTLSLRRRATGTFRQCRGCAQAFGNEGEVLAFSRRAFSLWSPRSVSGRGMGWAHGRSAPIAIRTCAYACGRLARSDRPLSLVRRARWSRPIARSNPFRANRLVRSTSSSPGFRLEMSSPRKFCTDALQVGVSGWSFARRKSGPMRRPSICKSCKSYANRTRLAGVRK